MAQLKAGVGASDTLFQHSRPNNPKRSRFDLSRITNFTADAGMIIPFDWFFCLPNDDVDIDFEYILDTLPLVSPSLTQYKVVTHWYAIDCKDLWEGWETFITRGRSGNVNLSIPQIDLSEELIYNHEYADINKFGILLSDFESSTFELQGQVHIYSISKHSLSAFLGCPPNVDGNFFLHFDSSFSPSSSWEPDSFYINKFYPYRLSVNQLRLHSSSNDYFVKPSFLQQIQSDTLTGLNRLRYVSALPFMAYQNIVKYNYVNQNLLQGNTALFPEKGDHDWFLPYEATTTNYVGKANNTPPSGGFKFRFDGVYTNEDNCVRLDCLRYAQFDDDYFTSGLPWLQRGTTQELGIDVTLPEDFVSLVHNSIDDLLDSSSDMSFETNNSMDLSKVQKYGSFGIDSSSSKLQFHAYQNVSGNMYNYKGKLNESAISVINSLTSRAALQINSRGATASITANQLREMIAMSVWQERNARVDGSYNAMIYQHWQSNPHGLEHKPHYIGGTADYVNFATILQSSQSTSDSPLGSTAGRGSTGGNAKVGHYHANDYSYVMGIMIIKPVTTYQQGVERHLTQKVFEDFVQPEFEGLSPEPILNQELYVSKTASDNPDLFAYQERYVYLKVRQNVNRGLFQTSPEKDRLFGSFTQARWFKEKPVFSYQFLCMSPDNMRRDWLAYPSQPAFKIQAGSKVFVTRSLSYNSEPNTFGF